jgi:hypothetical protein
MLRRYDRPCGNRYPTFIPIRTSIRGCADGSPRVVVKLWSAASATNRVECNQRIKGDIMGVFDNAKDAAEATGKRIGEWADDTKDRIGDKVDEARADAEVKKAEGDVKKAEADRDATEAKNDYKEGLRD